MNPFLTPRFGSKRRVVVSVCYVEILWLTVVSSMTLFLSTIFLPFCWLHFTVETFPDSLVDPHKCGLSSAGFVCDPDHILKPFSNTLSGAEYLSQYLQQIRYITNCSCIEEDIAYGSCPVIDAHGYTLSIVIMASIDLNTTTTNKEDVNHAVEKLAQALRRRYNRGQCADDALIVVLTDWEVLSEPLFAEKNYLYGLTFLVNRYAQLLQFSHRESKKIYWWMELRSRIARSSWLTVLLGLLVIVNFLILFILLIIRCACREKQTYTLGRRQTAS
ncbi:unnamed protein product [Thelazia callipaeda]|uniref:Uncharacterized protein n=1 Tax=Thelazia callipaeda TaxID=103827 RepID=A0A0N5D616_THECL|nr:unnamed protein product [Thelazia callipaeda]